MSHPPLSRLAGPLALAAGTLFTVTQLVAFPIVTQVDRTNPSWRSVLLTDPVYLVNGVAYFGAFCLLLIGLTAAYEREASSAGTLGVIGVCAAIVGTMSLAGNFWFEGFVSPWLADVAPEALDKQPSGYLVIGGLSSYLLFSLGWVLFGLSSLRARVFPATNCLAIVVGGLIGFLAASPPFGVPLGLAITWLGVWMMRPATSDKKAVEPAAV